MAPTFDTTTTHPTTAATNTAATNTAAPGLKGVVVAETTIGDVRGAEGFFHYRQYSAVEVAERRTFLEAWHLLAKGHLPSADEGDRFRAVVGDRRRIPPSAVAALPAIVAGGGTPLAQLAAAVALTAGAMGLRPLLDLETTDRAADALALAAVVPTLVAALHRLEAGGRPIEPDPESAPSPTTCGCSAVSNPRPPRSARSTAT